MSLVHLLLCVSLGVLALLLAVYGYLKVYQRKLDQAVKTGKPLKKPMIPPYKIANAVKILILLAVALPILSCLRAPCTSVRNLEKEVQQRAAEDGMQGELVMTEGTAAALYYAEDDSRFALYENRGTVLDDYCFIHGGSSAAMEKGLRAFRMEDTGELVLFSMNMPRISKIVSHDGTTYHLDPESPFVLILPSGGADLYDAEGNLLDLGNLSWYEITVKE